MVRALNSKPLVSSPRGALFFTNLYPPCSFHTLSRMLPDLFRPRYSDSGTPGTWTRLSKLFPRPNTWSSDLFLPSQDLPDDRRGPPPQILGFRQDLGFSPGSEVLAPKPRNPLFWPPNPGIRQIPGSGVLEATHGPSPGPPQTWPGPGFGLHLPGICWLLLAVGSLRPDTPWTLSCHGSVLPFMTRHKTPRSPGYCVVNDTDLNAFRRLVGHLRS